MTWSSASGELAAELASAAEVDAEAALVARARTDPAAFEELYLRHQRAVWRYLRHRTGDAHAADDLAADVFVALIDALPGFRLRGVGVRGWLYRVATRKVARWSRNRRSLPRSGGDELDANAASARSPRSDADCARDHVRAALDELPRRFQAVLVLHHIEGLAVGEIAAALGVREGTVRSRLSRGRAELKRRLIRNGGSS